MLDTKGIQKRAYFVGGIGAYFREEPSSSIENIIKEFEEILSLLPQKPDGAIISGGSVIKPDCVLSIYIRMENKKRETYCLEVYENGLWNVSLPHVQEKGISVERVTELISKVRKMQPRNNSHRPKL